MLGSTKPIDCKGEVTRDMLEDMLQQFDTLSDQQGILNIELRGNGLFVKNHSTGTLELVGVARMGLAQAHLR